MIKHYTKLTFRNLKRHKSFSIINLLGLTLGITLCFLIAQYVTFQFSFDRFHEQKDRLYRVTVSYLNDKGVTEHHAGISNALGPFLEENFADVVSQSRMIKSSAFNRTSILKYESQEDSQSREFHEEGIYFVDAAFPEMFNHPIIAGNTESPLSAPYSMMLSESAAQRYFGNRNPIGKVLTFNEFHTFEVTGVFRDPPLNSHQQFDFLLNLESIFEADLHRTNLHLYGDSYHTYILLRPEALDSDLEAKIQRSVLELTNRKPNNIKLKLQAVPDIHLYSQLSGEQNQNGSALITYSLSAIALLVLLLAWSNFTNLSLLRNSLRTKEAGVRKSLGALKHQLTLQFVYEALLINIMAFALSLALMEIIQPFFSNFLGYELPSLFSFSPGVFTGLCLIFVLGSLISGFFPSLSVSRANPATTLKSLSKIQENAFRKGIVTFQMMAVFVLVTSTYVIIKQMDYIRNKDLGLNVDQVLVMNGPKLFNDASADRAESYAQFVSRYQTFKSELLRHIAVTSVSSSNYIPGDEVDYLASMENPEAGVNAPQLIKRIFVNYDFDEVYNLDMLTGRFFSNEYNDTNRSVVLNESAIKLLGFSNPESALGREILYWDEPVTIVGVAKDFHFNSLKTKMEPMFFWLTSERTFISVKLKSEDLEQTIHDINETWESVFPGSPFHFFFADDYFNNQYKEEQKLEFLISIFALVAIVIASLGLFGLAAFMMQRRTKEIGIRKVLGASVSGIVRLLSVDFLKLVAAGFIIAIPLSWYAVNKWLSEFAYKVDIGAGIFLLAGFVAILITLLTVSWQSVKAAVANPVDTLRSE